jgi:hypothetical protein
MVICDSRGPWGATPEDAYEILDRFNEAGPVVPAVISLMGAGSRP